MAWWMHPLADIPSTGHEWRLPKTVSLHVPTTISWRIFRHAHYCVAAWKLVAHIKYAFIYVLSVILWPEILSMAENLLIQLMLACLKRFCNFQGRPCTHCGLN